MKLNLQQTVEGVSEEFAWLNIYTKEYDALEFTSVNTIASIHY